MTRSICILALTAALLGGGTAHAITNGSPDEARHPNVGALDLRPMGFRIPCSGTLISPTVFLTAGHCADFLLSHGISQGSVTFEPEFATATTFFTGSVHLNPNWGRRQNDPGDWGVVVFEEAVPNITPAALPTFRFLDSLGSAIRTQTFVEVGYGGDSSAHNDGGPLTVGDWGTRRYATQTFYSLSENWLRLSGNAARGDGSGSTGDSGCAHFLGNVLVSTGDAGDVGGAGLDASDRLDSRSARAFLGEYVTLP